MDNNPALESPLAMLRRVVTPSELETRQIRQILAQQQSKLEQLSGKVTEARAVLDKLLAEETEAIQTHDACRALLSPIRSLPPELLGIIFVLCIPDDPFVRPEQRQAPVLLTRVSVSWRAIAFSIPELWSSLRIAYNMKSRGKDRSKDIDRIVAPSMSLWLSRSGCLPLSISLEGVGMKQSILDVLFNHSTHCRRLELKSIHSWSGLEIPDIGFPVLKQLHVQSLVRQIRPFSSTFASAPALREVYWEDGSDSDGPSLTLSLPWAQLKRLTLGTGRVMITDVGIVLDIFAMCPLLEYCSVTFEGTHYYATPRNQILLPNLSSLVLNATSHMDDYSPMFAHLVTPRLRNLTCVFGTAWPPQVFSSFINRSACALTSLYLRHLNHLTQITEYLQIVSSSVKSLTIHDPSPIITDELLSVLTPTFLTPCLCPNLEILNLLGCVTRTRGALAAMVRSRLLCGDENAYQPAVSQAPKLKQLGILYGEGDLDELRYLRRFGLVINTTNSGFLSDI